MKITISDQLFEKIVDAERRRELSWLLDMSRANSWWSTQVGVKHLAQYCPSYLRVVGIILNNIHLALLLLAVYLFFTKEFNLGILSLIAMAPFIYIVPKLACRVVRFYARRDKMFFIDLYVSGILHVYSLKRKEAFSYPHSLEEIL